MKKIVLLLFFIISFELPIFANVENNEYSSYNTNIKINNYKKADTISFDKYLYAKKTKRDWKKLKLNKNGDVIFKNKVVLTNKGLPLNDNTAYTDTEFKILFAAKGINPKKDCNPNDIFKNGSMGCFIDNPDENNYLIIRGQE